MSIPKSALRTRKLILALGVACTAGFLFVGVPSASALFTQCPPIGDDEGCQVLITVNPDGTGSVSRGSDPGTYEGAEDALVGLQNNSAGTVNSIDLSSSLDIFGFDGDGLCESSVRSTRIRLRLAARSARPAMRVRARRSRTSARIRRAEPSFSFLRSGPRGAACSSGGSGGSGTSSAYFSLEESISAADINLGHDRQCASAPGADRERDQLHAEEVAQADGAGCPHVDQRERAVERSSSPRR